MFGNNVTSRTSATTAVAFFATSNSKLVPVSAFGFWAAAVVIINYLLVITLFPSLLVIWTRHWEQKPFCRCWSASHGGGQIGSCDTVYDRNGGCINAESQPCQFIVGNESVGDNNSNDMHKTAAKLASTSSSDPPTSSNINDSIANGDNSASGEQVVGHDPTPPQGFSKMDMFFQKILGPFVVKYRYVIVVGFCGLLIGTAILALRLTPPQQEEVWLPPYHNFQQILDDTNKFPASSVDQVVKIDVTWGISGADGHTSRWDPNVRPGPVFDELFADAIEGNPSDVLSFINSACSRLRNELCDVQGCVGGKLVASENRTRFKHLSMTDGLRS